MRSRIGLRLRVPLFTLAVSLGALLAVGLAGASSGRTAADPIEGTWNYGTGQILVTRSGADAFVGVVTKTATFSAGCPHPAGEKIWQLRGSGGNYNGTHQGFGTGGCSDPVVFPATWEVTETDGKFEVEECVTITTAGNRVDCATLERAKPPAAAKPVARSFYRAYQYFPGTVYDTKVTRSYSKARGTVTVTPGATPACLVKVRGLKAGVLYSIYFDPSGSRKGDIATAGPWTRIGTFKAPGGAGSFRCTTAPPSGTSVYIGIEPEHRTVLISANLP